MRSWWMERRSCAPEHPSSERCSPDRCSGCAPPLSLAPMDQRLPIRGRVVTLPAVELQRSLNGAVAGMAAAGVWAAQQPLDKKVFESGYDDVELLGKLVVRDNAWPAAGAAFHLANGALFGAVYAQLRPFVPGHPVAAGVAAGMLEHFGSWPLGRLADRY